jgi:aryl-alcohol dehydrogenase
MPALNFSGMRPSTGRSPYSDDAGASVSGLFFGQSSFASHSLASERNVVKIRSDVPLALMGPLGCGIQTGAGTVMNTLKPSSGDSIVVFGAGSVGLSAVMAARVVGCATIIAVDLHQNRLDLARELGATHVLNASTGDVVNEIVALTGDGAQFAVECTGSPKVLRQAVEALRVTGVCAIVGASPRGTEFSLPSSLLGLGRTIKGVVEGDSIADLFIPELIELWRQGRFPFDKLIRRYPMAQINEAIAASESGEVLKPVLCN